MKLSGVTKDKNGNAFSDVIVEVKDLEFQTLYCAKSNHSGYYIVDLPANKYPFVTAVKEYGENYLEYWCHNIDLSTDRELDITIDTLEIYGLNVFAVKGGYNSLMVYFRPMSLKKFQNGEKDICPNIKSINVYVDGQKTGILSQNEVCEYCGDNNMKAFLLQTDNPNADGSWTKLDVIIRDENNDCGAASVYN